MISKKAQQRIKEVRKTAQAWVRANEKALAKFRAEEAAHRAKLEKED